MNAKYYIAPVKYYILITRMLDDGVNCTKNELWCDNYYDVERLTNYYLEDYIRVGFIVNFEHCFGSFNNNKAMVKCWHIFHDGARIDLFRYQNTSGSFGDNDILLSMVHNGVFDMMHEKIIASFRAKHITYFCEFVIEELMAKIWHPDNMEHFRDIGFDVDE